MKRIIFAALVAVVSLSANAESEWVIVAETPRDGGTVWSGKVGSLVLDKNPDGKAIVRGLFQVHEKRSGRVNFEYFYVKLADCVEGAGSLVTLSVADMSRVKRTSEFAIGGNSVSSTIAEVLCTGAERQGNPQEPPQASSKDAI